jgi:O-antigen/teichoic acid export membrane protein
MLILNSGVMYKTLRSFFVYGFGEIIARLITFLSFLVLARSLNIEDYGQIETYIVTIGLIGVVGAAGLNNALQAFYYSNNEYLGLGPSQRISTAFYTLLIWQLCLLMLGAMIVTRIHHHFSLEIVLLLPCIAALTIQLQLMQDVFRLRFQPTKYLLSTILSKGAAAIISVALVLMGDGISGYLWGYALTLLVSFLMMFYLMRDDLRISLHPALAKGMFNYGLPFVFVGIGSWALASLDRWLLADFLGLSAVGEYAFAVRISLLVSFLSLAFGQAWAPLVFKLKESRPLDYLAIYADSFLSFTLILAVLAAIVSIFSFEFQGLLFDNKFQATSTAIFLLSFGAVIQATTHFTAIGISLSRKTRYFAVLTWSAAGLSLLGNSFMIPYLGINATALMTFFSTTFLSLMYFLISQREYRMRFLKQDVVWFAILLGYMFFGSAMLVLNSTPFESNSLKISFLAPAFFGVVVYLRMMVLRYGR